MSLTFSEYQEFTRTTRIYNPKDAIVYPMLGLAGETGECSELVKKMLRDDDGIMTEERKEKFLGEIGDVLYYVAALADDVGFDLGDIVDFNVSKLTSRKERGVLSGSGSNR